jgi:serine protease
MRQTGLSGLVLAAIAAAGLIMGASISAQDSTAYEFLLDREQVVARQEAFNDQLPYIRGEVLVKFRPGFGPARQARALSVVRGVQGTARTRWIGDTLHVRAEAETDSEGLSEVLSRQPEIEWAHPNYFYRFQSVPNDPSYSRQWNLDLINMPSAWDITGTRSGGVTVAVIDSGVTTTNASQVFPLWTGTRIAFFSIPFRQNPDIGATRYGTSRDFVFWAGPVLDMDGHGTHVAGTVLQETNNGLALAGVASHARLMALKACFSYWDLRILVSFFGIPGFVDPNNGGGCDTAAAVAAIRYAADNGAQILNLSIGGPFPAPAYLDAIQYAVQRGVFIAIAGGNEFEEGNPISYPAAYAAMVDGAMSVAAVNRSRGRASYSNTGSHIEIAAPGGDVRDGGATGVIYQAGLFDPDFDPFNVVVPRFDRYYDQPKQGTSMASPHVAGVAALLYAQGITNPAAIEAAIRRFAVDLGPQGRDNEYGFGLIDARAALRGLGVAR